MENWKIERVVAISPAAGSDSDAAYLVTVGYGDERAEVVVEFAPSSVASGGYAEEVVRNYLADDEPPQRIAVASDGSLHVEIGPLDDAARVPRALHAPREPQRGRRRPGNRGSGR